jgi:hypothetical protein
MSRRSRRASRFFHPGSDFFQLENLLPTNSLGGPVGEILSSPLRVDSLLRGDWEHSFESVSAESLGGG